MLTTLPDINVDESTNGGNILGATGSPLLDNLLQDITQHVPSPFKEGKTVFDDWLSDQQRENPSREEPSLALMGTGSDYTVFFDHLGIPSVDMIFNKQGISVYPYHSNYDSYYWLEHFGDPEFKKHQAMAQIFGLLAVRLAGVELVQFQSHGYYISLRRHLTSLQEKEIKRALDYKSLETALATFDRATRNLDTQGRTLMAKGRQNRDPPAGLATVNKKYMTLEKTFLLEENHGLPGRPWYRHMVGQPARPSLNSK